jgi:cytochrome b pre-mRNA-processing protein 3
MLKALQIRRERRRTGEALCARLSKQARAPDFHTAYRVSDTFDGRFDLLVLHAWMVLEALRDQGEQDLAQSLVDTLFVQLDDALREQGAGDMGMNRRMKKMGAAFYGRLEVYRQADGEAALVEALTRNVYRGDAARIEQARALAKYVAVARAALARSKLAEGEAEFRAVPAATETDDDIRTI